jgi:hypothetical protein
MHSAALTQINRRSLACPARADRIDADHGALLAPGPLTSGSLSAKAIGDRGSSDRKAPADEHNEIAARRQCWFRTMRRCFGSRMT